MGADHVGQAQTARGGDPVDRRLPRTGGRSPGDAGHCRGAPGIGKTALWQAGLERARARGARVLSHRAVEPKGLLWFRGHLELLAGVVAEALPSLGALTASVVGGRHRPRGVGGALGRRSQSSRAHFLPQARLHADATAQVENGVREMPMVRDVQHSR